MLFYVNIRIYIEFKLDLKKNIRKAIFYNV